jgi:hypothetical protein
MEHGVLAAAARCAAEVGWSAAAGRTSSNPAHAQPGRGNLASDHAIEAGFDARVPPAPELHTIEIQPLRVLHWLAMPVIVAR